MNLETYNSLRKTTETEDGTIGYIEIGDGPVALFVHGAFVTPWMWRQTMEAISDERRCIAFELPGHGLTRVAPDADLTLPGLGAILERFADKLELEDIDLIANDTGGAVAQDFMVRRPERIRSLTLTNCEARDVLPSDHPVPHFVFEQAAQGQLADLLLASANIDVARSEAGLGLTLENPEALTEEDVQGLAFPHTDDEAARKTIERMINSLHSEDLAALQPKLKEFNVPTLLVWGTGDCFFGIELARWIQGHFPNVTKLVEVDGGRLFWPTERPGELIEPLREHLRSTRAQSPAVA